MSEQPGVEDRVKRHLLLSGGLVIGIGPGGDLEAAANPAEAFGGVGRDFAGADDATLDHFDLFTEMNVDHRRLHLFFCH